MKSLSLLAMTRRALVGGTTLTLAASVVPSSVFAATNKDAVMQDPTVEISQAAIQTTEAAVARSRFQDGPSTESW